MKLSARLPRRTVGLAILVATGCGGAAPPPAPPVEQAITLRKSVVTDFGTAASMVLTPGSLRRVFELPRVPAWNPQPPDRPRGNLEVYGAAGPSVVVIRTGDGHGTGFLVSADGLIVTNHHVIRSGLSHDAKGSSASVHRGQLNKDGVMEVAGQPVTAMLYKVDDVNDLALLKLERAADAPLMPFIRLAASGPRPGLDCAILGHPSSGMLWTFRSCQVASVGDFPRDMVNLVLPRLAATGAQQAEIEAFVKTQPPRRILLSSAQANPGDSGGPVLDKTGALLGVTFGGPGNTTEDKFTYHVHLDEVRRFLAQVPSAPMLLPPDPWNFGPRVLTRDLDGDGKIDALVAGSSQPEVMLFDLDNDTPAAFFGATPNVSKLVTERRFDFEAGLDLRGSGYASFYDVDNDGKHDLILTTDVDGPDAKHVFTRGADGRWQFQAASAGQRILSGRHLRGALSQKLEAIARNLFR